MNSAPPTPQPVLRIGVEAVQGGVKLHIISEPTYYQIVLAEDTLTPLIEEIQAKRKAIPLVILPT